MPTKHPTGIHAAYAALLSRGRLTPNANQAALVDHLSQLQQALVLRAANSRTRRHANSPIRGLYIHGPVGTGKSRLADLFASTLPSNVPKRRVHFHEFMMDIHSRLHRFRTSPPSTLIHSSLGDPLVAIGTDVASESKVVCFDEFQVTDIADAMILKRLFAAFWEGGGVVVATSNRAPAGLYERGLNRGLFLPFIKELEERCEVWELLGGLDGEGVGKGKGDYRMREQERVKVFFVGMAGEEEFEKEVVKGGGARTEHGMREVRIPVMMNRELRVQAYIPGGEGEKMVVRSTFRDLFEGNLGASDYHALCKAANTVYVSGLRQFRADELDFVRRFITLVDVAYEAKTRIVCLSSVPLFQVFEEIVPSPRAPNDEIQEKLEEMSVRREGGSSSSMMSTFIGEMEWSATGLRTASLASGGAGETDVKFAIGRAVSRLFEMGAKSYGVQD